MMYELELLIDFTSLSHTSISYGWLKLTISLPDIKTVTDYLPVNPRAANPPPSPHHNDHPAIDY